MTYGNNILDFYYNAYGTPILLNCNGNLFYYITNLQGDVIRLVDIYGNIAAMYQYDPYGNVIQALGSHSQINPLRYRGYYYDNESGLYYLQSRYYDPNIGRFINADAFVSTGQGPLGYNMFAYCNNNPVNKDDPSGLLTESNFAYKAFDGLGHTPRKYDVPLYNQGRLSLCWAYCQVMLEDYQAGIVSTQKEADRKAKELAISVHGEFDDNGNEIWNKGGWPTNKGESVPAKGLLSLYCLLEDGPIYAYYWSGKPKSGAHLVLITGVDLSEGKVYTNNPWGISGEQTYDEFLGGFLGMPSNMNMPLYSIIMVE